MTYDGENPVRRFLTLARALLVRNPREAEIARQTHEVGLALRVGHRDEVHALRIRGAPWCIVFDRGTKYTTSELPPGIAPADVHEFEVDRDSEVLLHRLESFAERAVVEQPELAAELQIPRILDAVRMYYGPDSDSQVTGAFLSLASGAAGNLGDGPPERRFSVWVGNVSKVMSEAYDSLLIAGSTVWPLFASITYCRLSPDPDVTSALPRRPDFPNRLLLAIAQDAVFDNDSLCLYDLDWYLEHPLIAPEALIIARRIAPPYLRNGDATIAAARAASTFMEFQAGLHAAAFKFSVAAYSCDRLLAFADSPVFLSHPPDVRELLQHDVIHANRLLGEEKRVICAASLFSAAADPLDFESIALVLTWIESAAEADAREAELRIRDDEFALRMPRFVRDVALAVIELKDVSRRQLGLRHLWEVAGRMEPEVTKALTLGEPAYLLLVYSFLQRAADEDDDLVAGARIAEAFSRLP
ncbi:MAG TPA: hypothetical protein VNA69_01835 [Thermoanaerobaculia bacterium]|nr:hypothetical protein [Thermoanaerobaculia bacterium]